MAVRVVKWLASQVFDAAANSRGGAEEGEEDEVVLQCGRRVLDHMPSSMRTELWLSRLHHGAALGAAAATRYQAVLAQGGLNPEVEAEIDKDTHRTFPGHPRLSKPEGQRAMLNVLSAYAMLDPEIGYCQGMNFLVGLLLSYIPREADAYGALVLLMQERQLRELYKPDMSLLQVRLWQLGKLLPPRLAEHLEAHCVLPVLYASSWFLTCFASDFPIAFAARVLDVVICDCYAAPMMKVAVGILARCEELLLELGDMELILEHLKQDVPKWPKPVLQDLLTDALSRPWTPQQLETLNEMNGAETVGEAVSRVATLQRSRDNSRGEDAEAAAAAAVAEVDGAAAAEAGSTAASESSSVQGAPPAEAAAASAPSSLSGPSMTARTLSQFSMASTLGALSYTAASRRPSFFGGACSAAMATALARQQWGGSSPSPPASPHERSGPAAAGSAQGSPQAAAAASQEQDALPAIPEQKLGPLPPPPSSREERVAWDEWNPLGPSALESVPAEQLHIAPDLRDLPDLDPAVTEALSQALSSLHADSSAGASAGLAALWEPPAHAAAAAAAGAAGEPSSAATSPGKPASSNGSRGLESMPSTAGSVASLAQWNKSASINSRLPSSPFESAPSWLSTGGVSRGGAPSPITLFSSRAGSGAASSSGGTAGLSPDDFGSFQRASANSRGSSDAGGPARSGCSASRLPPLPERPPDSAAGGGGGDGGGGDGGGGGALRSRLAAGTAAAAPAAGAARSGAAIAAAGSASSEVLHASGLAHLLALLNMEVGGGNSFSSRRSVGPAQALKNSAVALPAPQPVPAPQQAEQKPAAHSPLQPGRSAGGSSMAVGGDTEDLDKWSSWQSGDTQPSPVQPSDAHPSPLRAGGNSPLQAQQQQQPFNRTTSQPAHRWPTVGDELAGPGGGASPARRRAHSEQHEAQSSPAGRAQQLQQEHLDGFLHSASPRSPLPMRAMRSSSGSLSGLQRAASAGSQASLSSGRA